MRRHRPRPITDRERRDIERESGAPDIDAFPSVGFCHDCEALVDEPAGKLHRASCRSVAPERRRAS